MGFVLQNIFYFVLLLVLLCISATFSGAETVLFSLSRHERARMKKSKNRLEVMAANLMDNPRSLLTSLLMGNMTCNIIVFVISTLLLERLERVLSAGRDTTTWTARLVIVLLVAVPPLLVTYVADVFPKVVGSLNNTRIAPLIALPVATLVRLLWPISRALDVGIMRPVHRLVSGGRDKGTGAGFSTEELHDLLELSEKQGVIDVSENELLQEVVRIADLKVRDVMTPRVDMVAFNIKEPVERLLVLFRKTHLAKIPVYEGQIDNLLGLVYAKTLLLESGDGTVNADLRRVMQPARFVPELQTLDRLLVHFRQTRTQLAVVVDEFGGVVGVVALEDVVEQMVGDIQELHDAAAPAVQRVGTDEYLVPGDLSVADWMDAFGARVETTHTTTVAGLLAAILKRLPREGDEVRLDHLKMRVESMRGRRVDKVRLQLVAEPKGNETKGEGRS
ncbi:MAG TPA: hemolysin family protein [Phycisphaerae bacterium]|nr:hemolysin family protein [Phycisphaerae bacterium]